ncbi:MAG: TIGR00341 family protein [Candidatus Thorarchaeota archaeon]|nr:TIGR00341 family protein [Candidatus Thorarchaeota archaeon]
MKQVQIVVPYDKTEAVFDFLLDVLNIKNVIKLDADNAHMLQFRIPDHAAGETMEKLKSRGVGVEYGFIDMLDLKASLPREGDEAKEQRIQREAQLAVEEIYENVKSGAALSFDFMAFTIVAAVMAGIGLIQNNVTIIVASMLLSPLMAPMLAVALGYVVRDRNLFIKGTVNELISLGLSFLVGIIMALLVPVIAPDLMGNIDNQVSAGILTEITRRGGIPPLPFSALDVGVAVISGAAVAISVTRGDMSSLVGVAISAALMPPAVNSSLMFVLGLITGSANGVMIGVNSLLLLGMNIILIDISAIIMFRIKKLTAIADRSATWTAVTEFRQTRSISLYHTSANDQGSKKEDEAPAKFTPAQERPADESGG